MPSSAEEISYSKATRAPRSEQHQWALWFEPNRRAELRTVSSASPSRLARHASHDFREAQRAGRRLAVPLTEASAVSRLVAEVRTETLSLYRTETKSAIHKLREELDPDDQTLLILRVDRDLGWDELARLFIADGEPTPENVKRESARLRKRFQVLPRRSDEVLDQVLAPAA